MNVAFDGKSRDDGVSDVIVVASMSTVVSKMPLPLIPENSMVLIHDK